MKLHAHNPKKQMQVWRKAKPVKWDIFGPVKRSFEDICFNFQTELRGLINNGMLLSEFFWEFYLEANTKVA